MKKLLMAMTVGVLFGMLPVFAGGGSEEASISDMVAIVPVTAPEGTDISLLRKQMLIPAAVCFTYTDFTQDKNTLSMKTNTAVSAQIQRQDPLDNVDKTQVYQFSVKLTLSKPEPAGFKKRVSVAFTLKDIQKLGGPVKQPVQFALQQGIKKSRMKSGRARVSEITYKGGGRFTALVELM